MRALILAPFSRASLRRLRSTWDVVHEDWRAAWALQDPEELGRRLDAERFQAVVVEGDFLFAETFQAAPCLRLAGICRAALNQVDVEAATDSGVVVVNTPGRNANAVAELTLGLMLALARGIPAADRYVREGRWESPISPLRELGGTELAGRVAGIVGFGAVGRRVAALCAVFGMRVLAHDPFLDDPVIAEGGAEAAGLEPLLEAADYLTLHAAPLPGEAPLLDAGRIRLLKPGARLVNTASWSLVDAGALYEALRSGRLAGAAFDVFDTSPIPPSHPVLALPNVVLTPHIGGATDETVARHSQMMTADLERFAAGERPLRLVNPQVWNRRRGL